MQTFIATLEGDKGEFTRTFQAINLEEANIMADSLAERGGWILISVEPK